MAVVTGSNNNPLFVIMRCKRIKTMRHVYFVGQHNARMLKCAHLEKDAPPVELIVGGPDVAAAIRDVLERYSVVAKNGAVLALEFVVTASRAFFEGVSPKVLAARVEGFVACALKAFRDRFPIDGQIVSVALHRDERTVHLHAVVVPLVCEPDQRKGDKTPMPRLSAKRIVGDRSDMAREQTRFASCFDGLGLERGRERSPARHVSNRDHEAALEAARMKMEDEAQQLAAIRKAVEAQHAALASERTLIQQEREAAARASAEAEAMKQRAITRAKEMRRLFELADDLKRKALAVSNRGPASDQLRDAARQLEAARQVTLGSDDEWLAKAFALLSDRARDK